MIFLVISVIMEFGKTFWLQSSANKVIQRLRNDVYAHIQRLPVHFFDNLPAGKVVSRVTNDTEAVKDLFVAVLSNFFSGIITITGVYVALFLLDVRLGLISLFVVPMLVTWIVLYRKFATRYNTIIRSRLSEINAIINESIQGMSIIRVFRHQKQTKQEFEDLNDDYMKHQNKMLNLNAFTSHNLVNVLRNIAFAVVLWYFGSSVLDGTSIISLGVLYAFVDVLGRLFQPITGMVNQLANLDSSLVSAGRVFELMDEKGEAVTDGSMPRYKGNVVFDDVSFAYKKITCLTISRSKHPKVRRSLWSVIPVRVKAQSLTCYSGSMIRKKARSRLTVRTSKIYLNSGFANIWGLYYRTRICSQAPLLPTSV